MGNTSVITCRNGKLSRIKDWTTKGSYQNNQSHIIGIRQKDGLLHYYLDGKLSFTSEILHFHGDLLGFLISGKTSAEIDYLRIMQDRCINLVSNALDGYKKENLGPNINSPYAELHPLISHDGQSIYITRKGHPDNSGVDKRDDAWVSFKQKDGSWSKIKQLNLPINNNDHNQVISVSPDNNTLLIGNTYHSNGTSKGKGISITHRRDDGTWEIPKDVIIDNFYNQNPIHSIHLAANNQTLLMSLERNDSYGHLDLYVSFLQKNGHFTQPKNLGKTINTTFEDGTPFLAADGRTLYFSSSGHGGYGSTDIFVSRRLDNTWRNWTTPMNLGPVINTNAWEGYYSTTASGTKAFLVSCKGNNHIGSEDIYRVIPPISSKPDPVLLIKGKVYNAKTKKPMRAEIIYYERNENKEIGNALSDNRDGKYQVILPADKKYRFLSFKKGFYPTNESVDVGRIKDYTEMYNDLFLYPIEEGTTIPLNNIFFNNRSDELNSRSVAELDRLKTLMEEYPNMHITLNSKNIKRAEHMKDYLAAKGVSKIRITPSIIRRKNSFAITKLELSPIIAKHLELFHPELDVKKLKKGDVYLLNNTFFPADSAEITNNTKKELIQLAYYLKKNPYIILEIRGHTNGWPDHTYCDQLSTKRAKNVAIFLEKQGIISTRISYKGYGKKVPIGNDGHLVGRQRNQRVEIKILSIDEEIVMNTNKPKTPQMPKKPSN